MLLLEKLVSASGVSGNEDEVRSLLKSELEKKDTGYRVDTLGNILVENPEVEQQGPPRLLLAAHMDEVGLMVTSIEDGGFLRFDKVGGIDDRVLVSRKVLVGSKKTPGVIGSKAVHLQKPEERKKNLRAEDLYIDIGVKGKEEAKKYVQTGDYVSFYSPLQELGHSCYKGKAFDDRAGCAILWELLNEGRLPPFHAAFTVQEEVGLRGALVVGNALDLDMALIVETTSASDVPGSKEHEQVSRLGAGPVLSIMDASVVVDKGMLDTLIRVAEENEIPYQFRGFNGGGTDAGALSLSRAGVKTAVVSVPARYIHSPCSIINREDLHYTRKLVELFVKEVKGKK